LAIVHWGKIFDRITGPPWRNIKKPFAFRYYSSDTGYWLPMPLKSGLGQG
jgi:hypothetical protein